MTLLYKYYNIIKEDVKHLDFKEFYIGNFKTLGNIAIIEKCLNKF